jgi:hypothetical protein
VALPKSKGPVVSDRRASAAPKARCLRAGSKGRCYARHMASQEKQKPSVFGLGEGTSSDPNAWRPSKAVRLQDSGLSLAGAAGATEEKPLGNQNSSGSVDNRDAAVWRPSQVVAKRLSSLSPQQSRKGFLMPRAMRPALTLVFFVCAAYVFLKLWFMPTAGDLHPALAISATILALVGVLLIAGAIMRRRRKGSDDKSTLRL